MGAVLTAFLGLLIGAFQSRPIVYYYLDTPLQADLRFDLFEIKPEIWNNGGTDAPLTIILTLRNATFSDLNYLRDNGIECNESWARIYTMAWKGGPSYAVRLTHLGIQLKGDPQNFTISCTAKIEPQGGWSWIAQSLGEIYPSGGILLIYNRTSGRQYKKVQ